MDDHVFSFNFMKFRYIYLLWTQLLFDLLLLCPGLAILFTAFVISIISDTAAMGVVSFD